MLHAQHNVITTVPRYVLPELLQLQGEKVTSVDVGKTAGPEIMELLHRRVYGRTQRIGVKLPTKRSLKSALKGKATTRQVVYRSEVRMGTKVGMEA